MPTWCAWCEPQKKMSEYPHGIDSHGICGPCKGVLFEDLKKAGVSEKERKEIDTFMFEEKKVPEEL